MRVIVFLILTLNSIIALSQEVLMSDNATISFKSEAPLEIIEAESNDCLGVVRMTDATFLFKVRIRSFEGFNSPLQREHFNENYLESGKFPDAQFNGYILTDLQELDEKWKSFTIKGDLEIHGVIQERVIEVNMRLEGGDTIEYYAEFEVELIDFDIDVPRIVFEKLAESIQVRIEGILQ
ncbi:MAG: YceI family protein [Flavobacteriales bacterium]|nr:YceI family protein [Flavobacteriales bacterium]